MPVAIWRTKRASVALPKVYHQLAVRRGTGWSSTGVSASPSPARSSTHSPTRRPMEGNRATRTPRLHGAGEGRELTPAHPELAVPDLGVVLEEAARRRSRGPGAVLVVDAAVARAHEQLRLGEPPDRAAQVGAVDREDLESAPGDVPDPARGLRRRPVPGPVVRVLVDGEPGLPDG